MDARRGTVLNIRVVDDWAMSINGYKVARCCEHSVGDDWVLSIRRCKVRCFEVSVGDDWGLSISACKVRHVVFGHSGWCLSSVNHRVQGAARCFEHSDLVWVQRGIRSLSASSVLLLLLSVVNANRHVFSFLCRLF